MLYERIKALYEAGKIVSLDNYVRKGLITQAQADEIIGAKYN